MEEAKDLSSDRLRDDDDDDDDDNDDDNNKASMYVRVSSNKHYQHIYCSTLHKTLSLSELHSSGVW